MKKILSFVVNKENKILLLLGSNTDLQFHKSFWYVVTGGVEEDDNSLIDTVKREVMEKTGLKVKEVLDLDWILNYKSLEEQCTEYVFISYVEDDTVKLNEESIGYCWCNLDEFMDKVHWFYEKKELRKVLSKYIKD